MNVTAFPYIPPARPMAVDDRQLTQLAQVAEDAQHGNADPAACEWLLSACAPLLRELAARRHLMAEMMPEPTVAFLPAAR